MKLRLLCSLLLGGVLLMVTPLTHAEEAPLQTEIFKNNLSQTQRNGMRVTCQQLLAGQMTLPKDGRVNRVCRRARDYCFTYDSLRTFKRSGEDSPFPEEWFEEMLQKMKKLAEEWCGICTIIRFIYRSTNFVRSMTFQGHFSHKDPK
jgi:hypothetical protein